MDHPLDPFAGDPDDPAKELAALDPDDDEPVAPLTQSERAGVLDDLAELEVFRAVLTPRGVRGLVVDCDDCQEPHYFGWDLLKANLAHLLDAGEPRVHEPAFDPQPDHYVPWDYARGFVDGVEDTLRELENESDEPEDGEDPDGPARR